MKLIHFSFLLFVIFLSFLGSCRNDNFVDDVDAMLSFSADTLTFDTVFVSNGSVVGYVKIYNNFANPVQVSEINKLKKAGDQFQINIDGIPGDNFEDVIIPGGDSIYIFIKVNIDPTASEAPFVIGEDIEFITNGNRQVVHLMAWGQNARYYYGEKICDEVWDNSLPYIIVSRVDDQTGEFMMGVEVEEGCKLTIQAGTRVFFNGNSSGMMVRGTIEILGTQNDSVVFEGARLENFFKDIPGQYLGMFIYRGSTGNKMENFIMNESRFGITIGVLDTNALTLFTNASRPDLSMDNCVVKNSFSNALFAFNSNVTVTNSLMYGSTENLITLGLGGQYYFDHCTLFNSGDVASSHDKKIILISNFAADNTVKVLNAIDSAIFTNTIIYGTLEDEIDYSNDPQAPFNVRMDHCLLKTIIDVDTFSAVGFTDVLVNQDPMFEDVFQDDFHLKSTSPCIDAGINAGVFSDLEGNPRPNGNSPDLGAYEF